MLLLIILVIKTVLNYILLSLRQAGRSLSFSVQGATFKREFLEKAMTVFHFLLLQNVLATLSELLEIFYPLLGCCLRLYPESEYSGANNTFWPTLLVKIFRSPL